MKATQRLKYVCSAVLVFAGLVVPSRANAQNTVPITVGPSGCGFVRGGAGPLDCYTVNLTIGGNSGTAWVAPGFIMFRPNLEGANYAEAKVTGNTFTYTPVGVVATETITFQLTVPSLNGNSADPDNNGDADVVTGSITFNFSYGPVGRVRNASVDHHGRVRSTVNHAGLTI